MKKIGFLLFFLVLAHLLNAQTDETKPIRHYMGIHGGSSTGIGFSYRYWPKRFGLQITGLPIYTPKSQRFAFSVGLSGLFKIKKGKWVDIYSYLGNHFQYQKYVKTTLDYSLISKTPISKQETIRISNYNIGFGLGFSFHITKKVDLDLQGGFGIYKVGNFSYNSPALEVGIYRKLKSN